MRPTCIYDNLSMINELVEKENEKFFKKNPMYKLCDQLAVYRTEHHNKSLKHSILGIHHNLQLFHVQVITCSIYRRTTHLHAVLSTKLKMIEIIKH